MTSETGEVRTVAAADGARLSYEAVGDGPPVMFLHGSFTARAAWNRQRAALAPDFRLILRDLRGHSGAPAEPPPDYSFSTTELDDLRAVLDAEGLQRVHLVGHSTGGLIATLFALRFPERVGRLVLIEPTLATLLPADARYTAFGCFAEVGERDGPEALLDAVMTRMLTEGWQARLPPAALAGLQALSLISAAHFRAFVSLSLTEQDLLALAAPALFLYGERSAEESLFAFAPLIRARVQELRPDLDLRIVAGAKHNVHRDRPDDVNAAIREFFGPRAL